MVDFDNFDYSVKDKIEEEGKQARNLINYNVSHLKEKKITMLNDKKPSTNKGDEETTAVPHECGDMNEYNCSSTPLLFTTPKMNNKSSDYRARYWGQMMDTLKRTIDEIYSACETDESEVECQEVIMILKNSIKDFHSLIEKMSLFKEIESSTNKSRPCYIAWEERKISPGKPIMKQVLEKSKRAHSLSGQSSSTMSQTDMISATASAAQSTIETVNTATQTAHSNESEISTASNCTWADKVKKQPSYVANTTNFEKTKSFTCVNKKFDIRNNKATRLSGSSANSATSSSATVSSNKNKRPIKCKSTSGAFRSKNSSFTSIKSLDNNKIAHSVATTNEKLGEEWEIVNRGGKARSTVKMDRINSNDKLYQKNITLSDRPSRRTTVSNNHQILKRNKSKSENNLEMKHDSKKFVEGLKDSEMLKDIIKSYSSSLITEEEYTENYQPEFFLESTIDATASHDSNKSLEEINNELPDDDDETDQNIIRLDEKLADVESKQNELENELGRAKEEESEARLTIEAVQEKSEIEVEEAEEGHIDEIILDKVQSISVNVNETDSEDDGYCFVLDHSRLQSALTTGNNSITGSLSAENLLISIEDINGFMTNKNQKLDWSQITDDLDDDKDDDIITKLRTPGRCVDLHQKLSAPLRRRSVNSIQQLEEKQAKAKEIREKILLERTERVRELTKKVEEVRLHKLTLLDAKKGLMQQRLIKAEHKRQQTLEERVKKAQDEKMKVKEIAFIQTLEAAQKQHTILTKHQESEARLLEKQEERKKRMEEKAEREAAAVNRRKTIDQQRKDWLNNLQQKWKTQEEKRVNRERHKELQRLETVKAKESEREWKKLHVEQQQKTHIEQLKEKISKKHEESERRHLEQLAEISRKAFEMSVTNYSTGDTVDTPTIERYLSRKWCDLCNVMIDSDILLQSHLNGKKHKSSVKELLSGDSLEMEKIKKFNLEHLIDAPEDKPDPKLQAKKDRRKNVKKKIKKIRQKINVQSEEVKQLCSELLNEKSYPSCTNRTKYFKYLKDMRRNVEINDTGPWVPARITSFEKCLSDMFRCFECAVNKKEEQNCLLTLKIFDIFNKMIILVASQNSEKTTILPDKTTLYVLKGIHKLALNNHNVCYYIVFTPNIINLIDALSVKLTFIVSDNLNVNKAKINSTSNTAPTHCQVVEDLLNCLTVIFECFIASSEQNSFRIVCANGDATADLGYRINQIYNILNYIISMGIVDKLSDYLCQIRGPLKEKNSTAKFILCVLSFLSSLLKMLAYINTQDSLSNNVSNRFGDDNSLTSVETISNTRMIPNEKSKLLLCIEDNEMCGLICLLYGLLLYHGNSESKFDELPMVTGKIAVAGLQLINNLALVSLSTMQNVLSQEGTYLQLRHILSYLISYCTKHMSSPGHNTQDVDSFSTNEMLHEVILCVGLFCVDNFENQNFIQTGQRPTILQQLCQLPVPYISQKELAQCLFPTLISCCYNNPENTSVLELEMTCDLLSIFIRKNIDASAKSDKPYDENSGNLRFQLHQRFPMKYWEDAELYFKNRSQLLNK